ncbi:MAG: hypothetical protein ABIM85_05405 [candidate division WOR-3 bacterium]
MLYILFFYIFKSTYFSDSLYEKGRNIIIENIKGTYLENYNDSFEIFFEKESKSDNEFWVEGIIYIKRHEIKLSRNISGYSNNGINEALKDFCENVLIFLRSIFYEPPEVEEVKGNKVILKNGFLKGIKEDDTFIYGDLLSPSGYIKIEKVYEDISLGKILIKKRTPVKGEKLRKIKGVSFFYNLSLSLYLLTLKTLKGDFGMEENIKDGLIFLSGFGFRFKIHAPFSSFYFNPGIFFSTSKNLDAQKLSLEGNYLLNNFLRTGISFDIFLVWQRERYGKEVRAIDYLLSPFLKVEKDLNNINLSIKTEYSLGRILRNFSFEKIGGDTIVPNNDLIYKAIDPKSFNIEFLIGFNLKKP